MAGPAATRNTPAGGVRDATFIRTWRRGHGALAGCNGSPTCRSLRSPYALRCRGVPDLLPFSIHLPHGRPTFLCSIPHCCYRIRCARWAQPANAARHLLDSSGIPPATRRWHSVGHLDISPLGIRVYDSSILPVVWSFRLSDGDIFLYRENIFRLADVFSCRAPRSAGGAGRLPYQPAHAGTFCLQYFHQPGFSQAGSRRNVVVANGLSAGRIARDRHRSDARCRI